VNDISHDVFLRPIPQDTAINVSVKKSLILFLTLTDYEKTLSRTHGNVWEKEKCSYPTVNGRIQHATSSTCTYIIPSILLFRVDMQTLDAHKRIRSRRFTGLDSVVKVLYTVALRQLDHFRATI